jgi:hypothetical protein
MRFEEKERQLADGLAKIEEFKVTGFHALLVPHDSGVAVLKGARQLGTWIAEQGGYRWRHKMQAEGGTVVRSHDEALRFTMKMVLDSLVIRKAVRVAA